MRARNWPAEENSITEASRLTSAAGNRDFLQRLSCATPDALAGWAGPDTSE
jgi:hypothetical protein